MKDYSNKDIIFLDRDGIKEDLEIEINNTNRKVILISSSKGAGKSGLIQYLMEKNKYKYNLISTNCDSKSKYFDKGEYIQNLAIEVSKYEKINGGLTFDQFKDKYSENENILDSLQYVLNEKGTDSIVINTLNRNFSKSASEKEIFRSLHATDHYLLSYEYLMHYIKMHHNFHMYLILENIELIDSESLEGLVDLIQETKNTKFILEFTLKDNGKTYEKLQKKLKVLDPYYLPLEALPLEYYIDFVSLKKDEINMNHPVFKDKKYLAKFYRSTTGNLHEVYDIVNYYNFNSNDIDKLSYLSNNLSNLKEDSLYLMYLIFVHERNVKYETLCDFFNSLSVICHSFNETYEDIKELVNIKASHVCINDEIAKSLLNREDSTLKIKLAYAQWIDYYENEIDFTIYDDRIKMFFKLLVEIYPERILDYKKEFYYLITKSVDVKSASNYCLEIENKLFKKSYNTEILNFLFNIYYFIGDYENAYRLFINFSELSFQGFRNCYEALLLNRLCKYMECEKFLNHEIPITEGRIKFYLENIKIINLANLTKYEEALTVYKKLEKNKTDYQKYPEYGYFLRNATIVYSPINSLSYTKKSICFFKDDMLNKSKSHITYSMNCARINKFDDALNHLRKAKKLMSSNLMERHILLNNEVCIKFLQGNLSSELVKKLKDALLTTTTIHDQIRINANLIAVLTKLNAPNSVEEIINKIMGLINDYDNPSLTNKVFNNIISFYLYEKNYSKASSFILLLKNENKRFSCSDETSWRKDSVSNVLSQNKPNFVVCFISYWHFELEEFSMDKLMR